MDSKHDREKANLVVCLKLWIEELLASQGKGLIYLPVLCAA